MGQRSGVLLKEVAAFQRCPLIEVSLCVYPILLCIHRDVLLTQSCDHHKLKI